MSDSPYEVRACRGHFHVTVGGFDTEFGAAFPTREAAQAVADQRNNEAILNLPHMTDLHAGQEGGR